MTPFNLSLALLSFILICLGLFYKRLKQSPFNETLLATLFGVALSSFFLDWVNMGQWGSKENFMDKACRLTISMALMATALRIPQSYLKTNKKVQATLLLLGMPVMFLSSAVILHFVLGFKWLFSLLLGAIITPTDPVLAATIITGEKAEKLLPQRTRETLSFEAGANDGLAYPFVLLCILLLQKGDGAWQEWALKTVLWETGGAIVMGLALGYLFGKVLEFCLKRNWTAKPAILAFALSVAFFVVTALELINVNGILGVFMAGLMLKKTLARQQDIEEVGVQEMMSRLFTIPIFVFLGLVLPWQQWFALGWRAVILVVLILLFRRLPFLLLAKPLLKDFKLKDRMFMGWFGPMGVAALFYCFFSLQRLQNEEIWTITSLVVFSSVLVHGTTAYPFLRLYSRKK